MSPARVGLVALGVLLGLVGVVELVGLGPADDLAAALWLAGGVVVHDGLLAPLTVLVAAVALRAPRGLRARLPAPVRAPLAAGLLVLVTVSVTALPVLTGAGRRPDNPTLLDRDYAAGWWVFLALVVGVSAFVATARWWRGRGSAGGRRA